MPNDVPYLDNDSQYTDDEDYQNIGGYRVRVPPSNQPPSAAPSPSPTGAGSPHNPNAPSLQPTATDIMKSAVPSGRSSAAAPTLSASADAPKADPEPPNIGNIVPALPSAIQKTGLPPPPPSTNPTVASLTGQQAELSKPLNRQDPKYRPGFGSRVGRAVADFFSGGVGGALQGAFNPQAPGYYGSGATNARYSQDEATRQANLAGIDAQLGTQEKLEDENRKIYESITQGAMRQGQIERAQGMADYYKNRAEEWGGKPVSGTEAQDDHGNWWALNSRGERIPLPGEPKANVIADQKAGKVQEPKTEIELAQAYQTALVRGDKEKAAIYKATIDQVKAIHAAGKDTSAADLAKYLQVQESKMNKQLQLNRSQDEEIAKSNAEIDKKYGPSGLPANHIKALTQEGATAIQTEKDAAAAAIKQKYDAQRAQVDQESENLAGLTKTGKKQQAGGNSQPGGSKGTATATPPADRVRVRDKTSGKVGTLPKGQVDAAIKSGQYERLP